MCVRVCVRFVCFFFLVPQLSSTDIDVAISENNKVLTIARKGDPYAPVRPGVVPSSLESCGFLSTPFRVCLHFHH